MLGPGIGPGVSQDFQPLPQEQGYRYEQRTQQQYDNARSTSQPVQKQRKNEQLFEQFYQREMNRQK